MRGHLAGSTAVDACRDLAEQGATGLLSVDGPDGVGSVAFVAGHIVAAMSPAPRSRLGDRLVGSGYLTEDALAEALQVQRASGEGARLGALLVERDLVSQDAIRLFVQEQVLDALFDVLRWRYGAYEFVAGEAVQVEEVPLRVPVDEALVEVARRQQEWEELSRVIPSLDAVPSFRPGASSAAAALEPDEFAVLASVDGERSVHALAADLGYGEFEAARIVYGLCLLGIVEVHAPEDAVGAALDDALAFGDDDRPADTADDADATAPMDATHDGAKGGDATDSDVEVDVTELDALLADLSDDAGGSTPAGTPAAADESGTGRGPDADEDEPELFVRHVEDERTEPGAPGPPRRPDASELGPSERPEPAPGPSTRPPDQSPPAPGQKRPAPTARSGDDAPPPSPRGGRPAPADAKDPDVSEFLRELSRLALGSDDTGGGRPPSDAGRPGAPRTGDPPRRNEPDDRGRRKRGLFGRGG